jgi:hypothetical protein
MVVAVGALHYAAEFRCHLPVLVRVNAATFKVQFSPGAVVRGPLASMPMLISTMRYTCVRGELGGVNSDRNAFNLLKDGFEGVSGIGS